MSMSMSMWIADAESGQCIRACRAGHVGYQQNEQAIFTKNDWIFEKNRKIKKLPPKMPLVHLFFIPLL